ncbi:N-acyl-D-amino-acid deacylase family protein [Peterkaempfera bronchialis]|uniref:D-aminoacylase n=1 Tax=Peterkaempfera bronchialis TaxID=2126346 RepID=A0A345T716_9ACTN|nr:amidohydrolase family protein [Peterkaempfera bronchialis]AXI81771.1 D-aminoacylase [Peterkaempfera bronchialis]
MFDVVLRGGWVVDGTGAPPFRADVAVAGERIAAVGRLDAVAGASEVDVSGRYVMPGFVDAHVHADALADSEEVQLAALRQGVTTLVLGQDGLSFAPASAPTIAAVSRYFGPVNGPCPAALAEGCTVADLLAHYDRATALNVAYLAPAGTIRAEVMGFSDAAADAGQLAAMRGMVERALADGAVGLSTGLEYVPGRFADAAEVAALCAPVASAGGVYVTHMRGYEADAWRGMAEVAEIARRSAVATHVSHYHGPANMLTGLVDGARGEGLDVTFDAYPYLRGSSILAMVALPADVQRRGPEDTLAQLADPEVRNRLAREWFPAIDDVLDRITLSYVGADAWAWAEGLPLREAAGKASLAAGELVCELVSASALGAGCVFAQPPTNTEADMRTLLRHEAHMAGSDGILLGSRPHPRGWGTFARLLGRHTRELADWSWGEAALHLAGHPARRFGLAGRGIVRSGLVADLAVVDPAGVTDRAEYADPRRPADGVDHVLVGGQFVLRDRALTGARPGRGLRRGEDA